METLDIRQLLADIMGTISISQGESLFSTYWSSFSTYYVLNRMFSTQRGDYGVHQVRGGFYYDEVFARQVSSLANSYMGLGVDIPDILALVRTLLVNPNAVCRRALLQHLRRLKRQVHQDIRSVLRCHMHGNVRWKFLDIGTYFMTLDITWVTKTLNNTNLVRCALEFVTQVLALYTCIEGMLIEDELDVMRQDLREATRDQYDACTLGYEMELYYETLSEFIEEGYSNGYKFTLKTSLR